ITFLPLRGRLYQTPDGTAFGAPITTNGVTVSNSLRKVIYLPATNDFGNVTFFYTVSDGRTNSAGLTAASINVTAVNQPPVAVPDQVPAFPGIATSAFDVLANDLDAESDFFTLSSYTPPTLGTLSPLGGGQFTYTPNPGVFKGTDQFTYTIFD